MKGMADWKINSTSPNQIVLERKRPRAAVVAVSGGVCYIQYCPADVTIEIVDTDNTSERMGDRLLNLAVRKARRNNGEA
jgi:hypothetical protein